MIEPKEAPQGESIDKFEKFEEELIIKLMFDEHNFMNSIMQFLDPDYFEKRETNFVFLLLKHYFDKKGIIMTRQMCQTEADKILTAEDPHEEITRLINERSDPRDIVIIKDRLIEWARKKQYNKLYTEDAMDAHQRGDYEFIDKIIEQARNISSHSFDILWMHEDYERLFVEDTNERFTTGFAKLDEVLNEGGPIRGDVFCFMAPTGVGKSIALVNTATANVMRGRFVLHVSLEMTSEKTGQRYLGTMTNHVIRDRFQNKERMVSILRKQRADGGDVAIVRFPPDEVSVDTLRAVIDHLRRVDGKRIDVLVIDYLELMVPRGQSEKEYDRQKKVSTDICNLAVKENILVVTASQTNRAGTDVTNAESAKDKVIDLNKTAESYGKNMPLSYVVTINQTRAEYESGRQDKDDDNSPNTSARARLYIAKNRNGPKFKEIETYINYETMRMVEGDWLTDEVREKFKEYKKKKAEKTNESKA